jgi:hypothetical protein
MDQHIENKKYETKSQLELDELKKQQRQMKKILQHTGDKQRISSKELTLQISILVYR